MKLASLLLVLVTSSLYAGRTIWMYPISSSTTWAAAPGPCQAVGTNVIKIGNGCYTQTVAFSEYTSTQTIAANTSAVFDLTIHCQVTTSGLTNCVRTADSYGPAISGGQGQATASLLRFQSLKIREH